MLGGKLILSTLFLIFGVKRLLAENSDPGGCRYSCGTDFPHTMCMSEGTSYHCENLQLTPTSQLKDEVLNWHNLYRNELAGGKTTGSYVPNMQKMYWDDDLEKMARIWASQCEPANDRCRKLHLASAASHPIDAKNYTANSGCQISLPTNFKSKNPKLWPVARSRQAVKCSPSLSKKSPCDRQLKDVQLNISLFSGRFEVGQNVGVIVSEKTPQNSLNTFTQWVNPGPIKKEYFLRPGLVRSHPNSARKEILKRFFQVIWPDSYLLGCAEAAYDRHGFGHRLLVCNYGPSAFDRKSFEKIFSNKAPCSCCPDKTECPHGQSSDHPFSNLCTISSHETKFGETERIDSARHALLQLKKIAQSEILQRGRDLEIAGQPEFEQRRGGGKNKHFKNRVNEKEGDKSGENRQRGKSAWKSGSRSLNTKNKYCSIQCDGRAHVMCQPKMKKNKFCHERKLIPESETKNYVMRKFNEIRNHVAGGQAPHLPKASNMRMLVWDQELTKLAIRWAQNCPSEQDGCRDVERFHVNQIVSMSVSSENNNKSLAAMSVENIMKAAPSFPVTAIGQYNLPNGDPSLSSFLSQVLWANSSRVGCAEVLYVLKPPSRTGADILSSNQYSSLVCNFGEGGNVSGNRIYRVDEPCSHCPKGTSCSSKELPYLCVKK